MKNTNATSFKKNISRSVLSLAVAAGISLAAGTAFADDPTSMAPPVQAGASTGFSNGTNTAADSVFNWKEIPANQEVPLNRASFDQGGYQLYDTVGETIVVPFTSENLYVMKFATSRNGNLYFKNEGGYPVLYVPKGGYLENATVSGARWYPFGEDFHPAEPVFLGIAPSYDEFINLGWYSDTRFYGGYYGNTSFISGGVFLPTIGLFFEVGGHPYYGWDGYHHYYEDHPGFYRTNYYNRDYYHYAGSHYDRFAPDRRFQGYGNGFNHGYANGFNQGVNHGFADHAQRAGNFGGGGIGSGRTFRGDSSYGNGSHNYTVNRSTTTNNYGGGGRTFGGSPSFGGGQSGSGRTFRGASNYGGGQSYSSGSHNYSGGSHNYSGGQSYGGNSGAFSGGRQNDSRQNYTSQNYTSQNSGSGRQSFGGGSRSSFSSGGSSSRSNSGGGSRGASGSANQGGGGRGGWSGGGRSR